MNELLDEVRVNTKAPVFNDIREIEKISVYGDSRGIIHVLRMEYRIHGNLSLFYQHMTCIAGEL